MEKQMRQRVARDLMTGLARKGWILSQHAVAMVETLEELIEENDSLRETIEDAAKHRLAMKFVRSRRT